MSALRIEVDDVVVATVSTAGMIMIDVRLASYRTVAPRAYIDVGGATAKPATMLTFVAARDLSLGQRVNRVMFTVG